MNYALVVIVNKGLEKKVIDLALAAGAKGGTVIRGKGASIFEKKGFLGLDIEVEKDVIFIVTKLDIIKPLMETLKNELRLNEPNSGIAFVLNTSSTIGVLDNG